MNNNSKYFFSAALGFLAVGVSIAATPRNAPDRRPCLASMDASSMKAVVACFYKPSERLLYPGPFELLSSDAAARLNQESYAESLTTDVVVAAKLLPTEEIEGRQYSRVSVRVLRGSCEIVTTHTWARQAGKWRRHFFPALETLADRSDDAGEVAQLVRIYDEWLALDPYALRPASELLQLLQYGPALVKARMLQELPTTRHGDEAQLAARILQMNPDDDLAIDVGIRTAASAAEARKYFARVSKTACARSHHAASLISRFSSAEAVTDFLRTYKDDSPEVTRSAVDKFVELGAGESLRAYLTGPRTAVLRQHLERMGAENAAAVSAMIARTLAELPDRAPAREWLSYAERVSPKHPVVNAIKEEIERKR